MHQFFVFNCLTYQTIIIFTILSSIFSIQLPTAFLNSVLQETATTVATNSTSALFTRSPQTSTSQKIPSQSSSVALVSSPSILLPTPEPPIALHENTEIGKAMFSGNIDIKLKVAIFVAYIIFVMKILLLSSYVGQVYFPKLPSVKNSLPESKSITPNQPSVAVVLI